MNRFWMVYEFNGKLGPTMQHSTEASARKEAERLAIKHSKEFVVLQAICKVGFPKPQPVWEDISDVSDVPEDSNTPEVAYEEEPY